MNATVGDMNHDEGNENENDEHTFHQNGGDNLSKDWVIMDNQSTLDQFVNADYLTGIHAVANPMFGKFPVWFNPNGIANVLSLKTITDHSLVTYNSEDRGGIFTVHILKGNIIFI